MLGWKFEPSVLLGISLLVGGYLAALYPLRKHFPASRPASRPQLASFLLGVFAIVLALISPIDEIGDRYLFSVHMLQHLLLTLTMPPLMLLGTPSWLLRPLMQIQFLARLARFLVQPLFALALFNLLFAAYHVPALYDWTLRDHNVHIFVHLVLMAAAVITWMPVLSPLEALPRLSYPLQILYLFFQAIPPTILAALITFADTVLYPTYATASRLFGVTALEDQQIAGLVMWIPGTAVYLLALTIVFFKWFTQSNPVEKELPS